MTSEIVITGQFIAGVAVIGSVILCIGGFWAVLLVRWYKGDFD